jgi:type II secretory pathway component GspD/PulD (secretin)
MSAIVLAVVVVSGCAGAFRSGQSAAKRGDWDTAVAYYRQALNEDPDSVEVKVALERAMRNAAELHVKRARDLEAQDHLPGAAAEYRLAADLDPGSTLAVTKALELERRIREQVEAARPRPTIETLREQAAQVSPIPRLDPRTRVQAMRFQGAVQDLLNAIRDFTGINFTYDQGLTQILTRAYTIDLQDAPLEETLNQILSVNGLTFKVVNSKTILIYQDTAANRQKFEDLYTQNFLLSHIEAQEMMTLITQLTTTGPMVRPTITVNKTANSLWVKATASMMQLIEGWIKASDKPRAEVMIDVEILEVSRKRMKELGIDLSAWALGFTFSPEAPAPTPAAGGATAFPGQPPPFNLNTLSQGVSAADYYVSAPTALISLLENDSKTRLLARPQMRGREGATLILNLGDEIPVPTTTFQQAAFTQTGTIPTQFQYRPVGVNLQIANLRVTYQDEIIMDLTVDRSALGPSITVAGQALPSFLTRRAQTTLRLRDGESNLLAGLVRDEQQKAATGLPGVTSLPILRSIFGSTQDSVEQSDIVMIVTPRIVRGHDLTPEDLKASYVGTFLNMGSSPVPQLISLDAPPPGATVPATGALPPGAAAPPGAALPPATAPPPVAPGATPPRAPGVVPIQPVPSGQPPAAPAGAGQIVVTAPATDLASGSQPHLIPVQISGVSEVGTIALTVTFDPAVLRPLTVTAGTFMQQGGVTSTFVPKIDAQAGRIDISISRADQTGASDKGLLAGLVFQAGSAGTTTVTVSAVVTNVRGQAIPVTIVPATVTVR